MIALEMAKTKRGLRRKSAEMLRDKGRRVTIHKRKRRAKHNSRRRSILVMPVKRLYVDMKLCFSVLKLLRLNASMEIMEQWRERERNREFF